MEFFHIARRLFFEYKVIQKSLTKPMVIEDMEDPNYRSLAIFPSHQE
jgi:hypothetical protein